MRYQGGKELIAKHIADGIGRVDHYVEPFMGGLSVGSRVDFESAIFSDAHPGLAVLYDAWIHGWRPKRIDETDYKRLRDAMDLSDPMTTFAGFGLSFGGKWFGGFARCGVERDYQENALKSITRKLSRIADKDVRLVSCDYRDLVIPDAAVVYCDPPYERTTPYPGAPSFDHAEFWRWAAELSKRCTVYVSERQAPDGWAVLWEKLRHHGTRTKDGNHYKVEKVFSYVGT